MKEPKIFTCIPYDTNMELEKSYNEFMYNLPEDSWACFIDHDAMFTTKYWYKQLQTIINMHPEFDCFTAMTNRVYNGKQCVLTVNKDNHDIHYHRTLGVQLEKNAYSDVEDITNDTPMSGVIMLYKKETWKKIPFRKWPKKKLVGVDWMLHNDLKDNGHLVGLMKGIYVYHWYRAELVKKKLDSDVRVLIGMPMPRSYLVDFEVMKFCSNTMRKGWHWLNAPAVEPTVARNAIIAQFLTDDILTDYTHIFFLDADTIPPPDTIDILLAHDKDVVAGITPIRMDGHLHWNFQIDKNKKTLIHELSDKLTSVCRIGGSTILIKRKVIESIEYPHFEVLYPQNIKSFLQHGPILKGSDYNFCDKIIDAGFKIYIDPKVQCKHIRPVNLLDLVYENIKEQ